MIDPEELQITPLSVTNAIKKVILLEIVPPDLLEIVIQDEEDQLIIITTDSTPGPSISTTLIMMTLKPKYISITPEPEDTTLSLGVNKE